jgi:hypothetical protein
MNGWKATLSVRAAQTLIEFVPSVAEAAMILRRLRHD